MSEKLTEMKHSELTTILEGLGAFGVTANGLRKLNRSSGALYTQLAHIIENGVPEDYTLPPGLPTFEIAIDSRDLDSISKRLAQANIFESIFVGRDLLEEYSKYPVEHTRFIAIPHRDFDGLWPMKPRGHFSPDRWLAKWSKKNLFGGYHLSVCRRRDAAVHIALAMDTIKLNGSGMVLITGKDSKDWVTIDAEKGKSTHLTTQVDFSYDRPAIFELRKKN